MSRLLPRLTWLLPFAFLLLCAALFSFAWIIVDFDPDQTPWYIFVLLIILIFVVVFCLLGLVLYFVRTRFYKRYSANWYIYTSFKMAFFVALFLAAASSLAVLQLVTLFNVVLVIVAVVLLALYSYLGKKS